MPQLTLDQRYAIQYCIKNKNSLEETGAYINKGNLYKP